MKKKNFILLALLGISMTLVCIITISLFNDNSYSESSSLNIDSTCESVGNTDELTFTPESTVIENNDFTVDSEALENTTADISEQTSLPDTTVAETTVDETTVGETAVDETTVDETTVDETTAEETSEEDTTTEETTAHIHSYSEWILNKEPTCETNGESCRSCLCGDTEYQPIPAKGHTETIIAEIKPTCMAEGKSDGLMCIVCGIILKQPAVIPITDCIFEGATCINCGKLDVSLISLSAPFAGLYKANSLDCLYSLAADIKTPPASLTKMITACVAIENMPLDYVITVGTEQTLVPKNSSLCYIYKGQMIKLQDLLTGMLLCSGNDAAYTIAANVARYASNDSTMSDEEAVNYFCNLMNDYAQKIGAENTCFKTPDGFDKDGQYSTVSDLALITAHAMKNGTIANIVSIHYIKIVFESGQIAKWTNTNELINPNSVYYTENVTGFKTGGTEKAGKCLSATFEVNGEKYIAIVLGCKDNTARYTNILELINSIN